MIDILTGSKISRVAQRESRIARFTRVRSGLRASVVEGVGRV